MKKTLPIIILLFSINCLCYSQYFKQDYQAAHPKGVGKLALDKQIDIYNQLLAQSQKEDNTKLKFYAHLMLNYAYTNLQEYVKSKESLLAAKLLAEKSKNPTWLGVVYYREAALNYYSSGKPDTTLTRYKLALKHYTQGNDSIGIGESYVGIASVYKNLKDYKKSKEYFDLALPIMQRQVNRKDLSFMYNNIAGLFRYLEQYNESIRMYDSAIAIAKDTKDSYSEMMAKYNMSIAYYMQGDFD